MQREEPKPIPEQGEQKDNVIVTYQKAPLQIDRTAAEQFPNLEEALLFPSIDEASAHYLHLQSTYPRARALMSSYRRIYQLFIISSSNSESDEQVIKVEQTLLIKASHVFIQYMPFHEGFACVLA
jgi:hypothetical protein